MPTKTILAPIDCTALSEAKLPIIEEYARAFGAAVILLHVLPAGSLPDLARARWLTAGQEERAVSPAEARAQTFLDTLVTRLRVAGIAVRPLLLNGPVAATILAVAQREDAALLILGSTRHRSLSRVFLGSVAEPVVRGATCPVLLIRPSPEVSLATPEVRSFAEDATRAGLLTPRILGRRDVDLARIVGSVGRAHELGPDFRPLKHHRADDERYKRILDATREGEVPIRPIDLYKLGYGYYVLDGHRRVAAARALGYDSILANVTEYLPAVDATAQQLFTARQSFERATGLTTVGAARPESYERLPELIDDFTRERGIADRHEAAERWRVSAYGPLVGRIRALRLNRYFPGERSADIILRVADHRRSESARLGHDLTWEEALGSFAAHPPIHPPVAREDRQ